MINTSIENGVMTLSIDRPTKKNALTAGMYAELAERIFAAQSDQSVRSILIRGEGENFCAGNDLADFLELAKSGAFSGDLSAFPPMALLHGLVDNQLPMIAAVQGAAIGIGLTLLLHCDLVVCADNVRLQTPFVDLGLVPEAASSLLLPARVGRVNAAEILLLGAPISADRALQMGLCNSVCSAGELDVRAAGLAAALASKPPQALAASKTLLTPNNDELHKRIDEEAIAFLKSLQSDEAKQALSQFFKPR
jgi:enoyl-CoA hydratase/carnithine racemase